MPNVTGTEIRSTDCSTSDLVIDVFDHMHITADLTQLASHYSNCFCRADTADPAL